MSHNITPLHDIETPPTLPDRRDLEDAYPHASSDSSSRSVQPLIESVSTDTSAQPTPTLPILEATKVNLLLMTPYVISHIAIVAIYDIGLDDIFQRISVFALSAVAILPWLVCLRFLRNLFYDYSLGIGLFAILYLTFILPVISITAQLPTSPFITIGALTATVLASQVFLLLLKLSLTRFYSSTRFTTLAPVAVFVGFFIVLAALT